MVLRRPIECTRLIGKFTQRRDSGAEVSENPVFRELRRQVGSSIGRIVSELPTIQELVSSLTDRPEFFVLFENPTLREGSTTQFLVLQVSVGLELDSALKRDAARGAVSSEADAEQTCGG